MRTFETGEAAMNDLVNHPPHYTDHSSGIECIQITEHMNFCLGNAVKYIWRAGLKSKDAITDLRKAAWYIAREISKLEKASCPGTNTSSASQDSLQAALKTPRLSAEELSQILLGALSRLDTMVSQEECLTIPGYTITVKRNTIA